MQPKIFISSKLQELKEERDIVEKAVFELWNNEGLPFKCWRWEERAKDIPTGKHPDEVQSEGVRDSDVYVLILGSEYGDFEYGQSPTHKEYDIACSNIEKDCILIYIKDVEKREDKLKKWIEEIIKHTYKPFKNSDQLKDLVKTRLKAVWEQKWNKGLDDDEKLPDIRVKVSLVMSSDRRFLVEIKAENHDTNSVFLSYPSIAIHNTTDKLTLVKGAYNDHVPTGELKPGDSISVIVDPAKLSVDADMLREVIFPDKIGRKLRSGEVVHHQDGDKSNFRRNNLSVMSRSFHSKLHTRMRKKSFW